MNFRDLGDNRVCECAVEFEDDLPGTHWKTCDDSEHPPNVIDAAPNSRGSGMLESWLNSPHFGFPGTIATKLTLRNIRSIRDNSILIQR
jgi:hypothetical protein